MAIQVKRQGGGSVSSASPAAPSSLNYGELAVASNGDLYVGSGARAVVGVVTTNGNKTISGQLTVNNTVTATTFNGFLNGTALYSSYADALRSRMPPITTVADDTPANWNKYPGTITFYSTNHTLNGKPSAYGLLFSLNYSSDTHQLWCGQSNGSIYHRGFNGSGITTTWKKLLDTENFTNPLNDKYIIKAGDSALSGTYRFNNFITKSWIKGSHEGRLQFYQPASGGGAQSFMSMRTPSGAWSFMTYNNERLYFTYGTNTNYNNNTNSVTQVYFDQNGYVYAPRVYNAVYNDYAEYFPRGNETEPGDIISLDTQSKEEKYIKAKKGFPVVGVHSNEYGHIIGGEEVPHDLSNISVEEYNNKKYIPVGLCGRCKVKTIGKIKKGDKIVLSDLLGIGRAYNKQTDSIEDYIDSIGIAVEDQPIEDNEIRLVRVKLK